MSRLRRQYRLRDNTRRVEQLQYLMSNSYWPGSLKSCLRRSSNALRKAELMITTLHRRRRRISQTMELMSCTYILLYDPLRLDLSFKSIAQGIKFFSRFGDQQRQLRQKVNSFLRRIYSLQ
jgi:hypothetical protein